MCGTLVSAVSAVLLGCCRSAGGAVDRSTVYRWVQKFGPELTNRTEKYLRRASVNWHVPTRQITA